MSKLILFIPFMLLLYLRRGGKGPYHQGEATQLTQFQSFLENSLENFTRSWDPRERNANRCSATETQTCSGSSLGTTASELDPRTGRLNNSDGAIVLFSLSALFAISISRHHRRQAWRRCSYSAIAHQSTCGRSVGSRLQLCPRKVVASRRSEIFGTYWLM